MSTKRRVWPDGPPCRKGRRGVWGKESSTQRKSSQLIDLAHAGVPNERRLRDLCKFSWLSSSIGATSPPSLFSPWRGRNVLLAYLTLWRDRVLQSSHTDATQAKTGAASNIRISPRFNTALSADSARREAEIKTKNSEVTFLLKLGRFCFVVLFPNLPKKIWGKKLE